MIVGMSAVVSGLGWLCLSSTCCPFGSFGIGRRRRRRAFGTLSTTSSCSLYLLVFFLRQHVLVLHDRRSSFLLLERQTTQGLGMHLFLHTLIRAHFFPIDANVLASNWTDR